MKQILQLIFIALALTFSTQLVAQNLMYKANKQYELKAYASAIESYLKVLQKTPNEPDALSRLADSYRYLNKMDEAENWYKKAAIYAGIEPIHYLNYGKVLMAQGKYEAAKKWFALYGESDKVTGEHFVRSCDYAIALRGKPATFRAYKEYLNSNFSDFGPAFFGDYVVYSSSRTDIKRAMKPNKPKGFSGSPNNQLYITSMDNKGYLRTPTLLQSDLQNNYNEGPVAFSEDGEWVVFTKNNFENGVRQVPSSGVSLSLYIAEVNAQGQWSNVKALPFNKSESSAGYPFISGDGRQIYFASNRAGGFGGWDLYRSFKTGDGWSEPQNLGPVVNSPGDEITPFLEDNALYFSSDYHHGLGGMDIFRAEKISGEWQNLFHLGNAVNSPYDDYGFIFENTENRGYFVTNRKGGQGYEDIYKVKKMTDNFVITVLNESSLNPIEGAIIDFSKCGEPSYPTDINGKYSFEALAGLDCEVIVKAEGYKPYSLKINSLGHRVDRNIEIQLRAYGEEFVGKIVDSETNESLEDVLVKATNRANGLIIRTQTDDRGEYTLALQAPEEYVLRFSKAGYVNTSKKVTITSQTDKSLLGILSFKKSYSSGSLGGGAVVVESNDDFDKRLPEEDMQPERILDEFDATATPKGYAVQVAAYFDGREVEVGTYEKLQDIGNVYKMKDKGAEKVRVGIFPTRAEAETAKKEITQKGYAKAFVVEEEGRQNFALRVSDEPEPVLDIYDVVGERLSTNYLVRVATFRSTKQFDEDTISKYGKVEQRKKGKYTIVLLSGFDSLDDALRARNQVVDMGYDDAHLVTEEGDALKKVK